MKKYAILLLVSLVHLVALADPACPDSLYVIQPNGDTLWTYLHGDEFYHWRTTIDGHVIISDVNNYLRYAIVEGDSLCPSEMIAHNVESRSFSEQGYVDSFSSITRQFIQAEIQQAYTMALNDTLLFPPAQHAASNYAANQPVVGTRKVLTILMEYPDYRFTKTQAIFDSLMNQLDGPVEQNSGSVRQYYRENSYGQLNIEAAVVGPFMSNNIRSYYHWTGSSDNVQTVRELVTEAINKAKNHVDFSTLDGDNDGYVDGIHVIFAGEGLSSGSKNSYIWPHKHYLSNSLAIDGKIAKTYIITPEIYKNGQLTAMGTICHELGHILGAPDYYDPNTTNGNYSALGNYDLMGGGSWNNSGRTPANCNPYTKCYTFQWDTPSIIPNTTKEYNLSSSTINKGHVYRINTTTTGEYFLLENRTKEKYDQHINNGGLLIYHIHKNISITGAYNNDIHPLKLYLVNASAATDPSNTPSSYGYSYTHRAYPGNSGNKTMFTNTSIPSAKAWDGSETGVNICFIQKNSNGDITFTVNPEIQGPSQLCGTRDYCVSGIVPDQDVIAWSYSTNITEPFRYPALRFEEGKTGACIPIERGNTINISIGPIVPEDTTMIMSTYGIATPIVGDPHIGTAKLYATITSGSGTYQMEKDIVMPEYATPSLLSPPSSFAIWKLNETRTLNESSCDSIEAEYIKWYVRFPNSETEEEFTGRSVTLTPTQEGQMTIRIVNDCGCNSSKETTYTYTVRDFGFNYPNPVITPNLEIEIIDFGEMDGFYTIEMWNDKYTRVRYVSTQEDHVQINVSDLPNGWYQIVLRKDGELIDSGNVMINN